MVIRKLLVANRGEIAVRVIRCARDLGISTVALYSDADRKLPHVREADEAIHLAGNTPAETYLRGDLILAAAVRLGVDAVHPGYGFLSENAGFARDCAAAGIVFVGPTPEAIDAMGNKVEAKLRMAAAGVPVLAGVTVNTSTTAAELQTHGDDIGYPILVKAAFGGGGRGMRIVRAPEELLDAVESAQREAAAAFGDGLVFLERFVESPRHIEVQIFGDTHGNVVHLFERECSIQRRHQKVIEESPSTAVDAALRSHLGAAAVAAGRSIDYVGAGTVEFVMAPNGEFFFLEVNTRLQVEHPVTECVTGLDLVALQLRIAQGEPLPREALEPVLRGHAIEARVYAEDVVAGFLPMAGPLHRMEIAGAGVRVDAGYESGNVVSTFYDALLAKVISFAPTRMQATAQLSNALRSARIHGVTTNRDLLVRTLEHDDFVQGVTDTGFLERNGVVTLGAGLASARTISQHAIIATVHAALSKPRRLGAGFRNVGDAGQARTWRCADQTIVVEWKQQRSGVIRAAVDNAELLVESVEVSESAITATILGERRTYRIDYVGRNAFVDSALGATAMVLQPRFADAAVAATVGSLRSPLPGSVIAVHVGVGTTVVSGTVLVALEAMKMEHSIRAPHDGVVSELRVEVGDQVETGSVLVVVDEVVQE